VSGATGSGGQALSLRFTKKILADAISGYGGEKSSGVPADSPIKWVWYIDDCQRSKSALQFSCEKFGRFADDSCGSLWL
jgi:hypothetical protein